MTITQYNHKSPDWKSRLIKMLNHFWIENNFYNIDKTYRIDIAYSLF